MKKRHIYISGPITGEPREKYTKRFAVAEKILRAHGYGIINHKPDIYLGIGAQWRLWPK